MRVANRIRALASFVVFSAVLLPVAKAGTSITPVFDTQFGQNDDITVSGTTSEENGTDFVVKAFSDDAGQNLLATSNIVIVSDGAWGTATLNHPPMGWPNNSFVYIKVYKNTGTTIVATTRYRIGNP